MTQDSPPNRLDRLLDAFIAGHKDTWSKDTQDFYRTALWGFCDHFGDKIPDSKEVTDWLDDLTNMFTGAPLAPESKETYYERIRFLFRYSGLPDLPYHRFRGRAVKGRRNGHRPPS